MTWLKEVGGLIKKAVVGFLDADDDGQVTLADFPRLIKKGEQLVALGQAGRELFGTSGAGTAKAVDAFIEEGWEVSRGNKPVQDEALWKESQALFRESMYKRAAALKPKAVTPEGETGE